jgi:hypothetical protein
MGTALNRLLDQLTHEERVGRYRQFAEQALQAASRTSDPDLRSGYLRIAIGWETLSEEVSKRQAMLVAQAERQTAKPVSHH